jgi:hypothetical protein
MSKKKNLNSTIFVPDYRNIGGRNQITDLIYNHQMSLLKTKPTLKTRISTPKPLSSKAKPITYKEILKFKEVFESFRRSQNVKLANFSSPPKTFHLKEMLQRKNTKVYKSAEYEHQLFLKSQKRRINDLTTFTQRKKNLFDYTVHPSLFFRRKQDELQNSSVFQEENDQISQKQEELEQQNDPNEAYELTYKRPPNSNNKQENLEEDEEKEDYELVPIPEIKGKTPENYNELKIKLIELIYDYRIFKSEDLESLFGRTLLHNKHMDNKRLQKIFKEIQEEFDS